MRILSLERSADSRHEAVMKLQKQLKVPKIEIDLSRIQQLSQEHDNENWEFRSWLKQYAPDDIDGLVKTLSQKNLGPHHRNQGGNWLPLFDLGFKESRVYAYAKTVGQAIKRIQKKNNAKSKGNPAFPT